MKVLLSLVAGFLSSSSFAGSILHSNLYSKHTLVQGTGPTRTAAKMDAESSIPAEYQADPANSPETRCKVKKVIKGDSCGEGDEVLFTIPLTRKK